MKDLAEAIIRQRGQFGHNKELSVRLIPALKSWATFTLELLLPTSGH